MSSNSKPEGSAARSLRLIAGSKAESVAAEPPAERRKRPSALELTEIRFTEEERAEYTRLYREGLAQLREEARLEEEARLAEERARADEARQRARVYLEEEARFVAERARIQSAVTEPKTSEQSREPYRSHRRTLSTVVFALAVAGASFGLWYRSSSRSSPSSAVDLNHDVKLSENTPAEHAPPTAALPETAQSASATVNSSPVMSAESPPSSPARVTRPPRRERVQQRTVAAPRETSAAPNLRALQGRAFIPDSAESP